MRETKKVTIDGTKYEIGDWHPKFAVKTFTKLVKIMGEPLVMVALSAKDKSGGGNIKSMMDSELDAGMMSKAFDGLSSRLDEDEVFNLLETATTEGILCEGKPVTLDNYTGKIGHMMRVALSVFKHQYSDFLG